MIMRDCRTFLRDCRSLTAGFHTAFASLLLQAKAKQTSSRSSIASLTIFLRIASRLSIVAFSSFKTAATTESM